VAGRQSVHVSAARKPLSEVVARGSFLALPGGVQLAYASLDPGASSTATDVELGSAPHVAHLTVLAGSTNWQSRSGQDDLRLSLAAG
jgi:hypothetical protein